MPVTRAETDPSDFCATATSEARAALAEWQRAALATREGSVRASVCLDAEAARRRIARLVAGQNFGMS
jgi:hypothetical protein